MTNNPEQLRAEQLRADQVRADQVRADQARPDQIRSNIEATRRELGDDVDALADKVDPSKIAQRQAAKAKGSLRAVRDHVMGVVDDIEENAGNVADDVAGAAHGAVAKAKGNPLAVGLIAFAAGWLISSLIPPSEKEKELASSLGDAARPMIDEAKEVAATIADDLKEPVRNAAESVKASATAAAGTVGDEARSSAEGLTGQTANSRENIQGTA